MIAFLETSYEGCTFLLRTRQAEGPLLELARRAFPADEATAERGKAVEHLLKTIRESSRPMGGKSWTNRDELYER